jgi:SAM-dependent methyltransferase
MEPNELRTSYDAVADTYAARFADELTRKPFDRELLVQFAADCPPGLVLDVGCGPGHVGRFLVDRGRDVTGIDLSPAMIEQARRLNPRMTFEVGDMRNLAAYEEGSVAGIVAFYSLIHIARDDVPRVLDELKRVLAPGGKLLLAVNGGQGGIRSDEFLGRPVSFEATLFERAELASIVEAAGFGVYEARQRERYDFETHTPRVYVAATRI